MKKNNKNAVIPAINKKNNYTTNYIRNLNSVNESIMSKFKYELTDSDLSEMIISAINIAERDQIAANEIYFSISENFEVVAASLNKKDLKGLGCAIIRVYNDESVVFWDTIAETFVNVFNKKFNRKFLLDCGFQKNTHGFYVNVTDAGKIMFEINYIDLPY